MPNFFGMSSAIVLALRDEYMSKSVNQILADNLRQLMMRPDCAYRTANALGVKAGIDPQTVRYLLDPAKRANAKKAGAHSPQIDKLEAIAKVLGCQVWELLHPDIEAARKEHEIIQAFKQDFITHTLPNKNGQLTVIHNVPSPKPKK